MIITNMNVSKKNNFLTYLQTSKNILLVRNSLGKPKPSIRNLPNEEFCYGKRLEENEADVAKLVSSWNVHKSSTTPRPEKDFKKLNIASIAKRVYNSPQQSKFRLNTDIRLKSPSPKAKIIVPNLVFGSENKPSTPIKAVLSNFYGKYAADNSSACDYSPKSSTRIPQNKSTRGFDKRTEAIKHSLESPTKSYFKLKKFAKVPSKTITRREKSNN